MYETLIFNLASLIFVFGLKSDEQNFVKRFRSLNAKKEIKVKRNENMTEKMVLFVKRVTFAAIEKFEVLSEILLDIQNKLGKEYGGHWYCMAYSMGAFPLRKIKGFFIEFELFDINFTIFESNN